MTAYAEQVENEYLHAVSACMNALMTETAPYVWDVFVPVVFFLSVLFACLFFFSNQLSKSYTHELHFLE